MGADGHLYIYEKGLTCGLILERRSIFFYTLNAMALGMTMEPAHPTGQKLHYFLSIKYRSDFLFYYKVEGPLFNPSIIPLEQRMHYALSARLIIRYVPLGVCTGNVSYIAPPNGVYLLPRTFAGQHSL